MNKNNICKIFEIALLMACIYSVAQDYYVNPLHCINSLQGPVDLALPQTSDEFFSANINIVGARGNCTFFISISASGGTPVPGTSNDYYYSIDGGYPVQFTSPATIPVSTDQHVIRIFDCTAEPYGPCEFEYPLPGPVVVDVMYITPPECYGDLGSVTVAITGGTAPYTVTFDGQEETDVIEGQLVTFQALPGDYTLEVLDYAGCVQDVEITIAETAELSIRATRTCGGINIIISGGTPAYQVYANSERLNIPVPLADQETFIRMPTGLYDITVVDSNGCSASQPYVLVLPCNVSTVPTLLPEEPPAVVAPPTNLCGYQECHRFPLQIDLINYITWAAGDQSAVKFAIYDASDLHKELAIIAASSPLIFCQHRRCCGQKTTYYIYAINAAGVLSKPGIITVP